LIIEEKKNNNSSKKIGSIEQALLKVADRLIGTLCLLKEDKKVGFSEDDRRLLALVANTASVAIENALLHKKLERLAITDGLTSLYNHRQFMESLYKEIKRAQRYNLIFSVILLDIDDFKLINDTYGHLKGDEVLKNLAKIIKENLHRGIDIAGRYGGEEFSIILSQTNKEGAVIISERIRLAVKDKLAKLSGIKKEITVSLGVATYPYDAKSDRDIIHVADLALYRAKREGKNRTVVASS
jgi:diguanylate cyclase (GGDEF)-like protein